MYRILFLVLFLVPAPIMADQWLYPAELKSERFRFKNFVVEKTVDTRKNQKYPQHNVRIFQDNKEIANYKNFTFDRIISFDGGNMVFAGSNSGLSQFSYFVLDRNGGLILAKNHFNKIPYCEKSVTLAREWLPETINIKETYKDGYLIRAQVETCKGEYFDIFN